MKGHASHARHGIDSTLAAFATLTAAWPISTLLVEPTWLRGTVMLLAVIVLSGLGARSLALHGWQVLMAQLTCLILAAGAVYGQGHLWHGLPTFETLGYAGRLIREAVATAQHYAAPAPTTPGLILVVGCALGLIALLVDYLAVTRSSPSLAGLPLLTMYLAAVANRGSTLPVIFFLAAAAMWLILVARADGRILRRWGTTVVLARTPVPQGLDSPGVYEHASMARMLGAMALVAAVAVPVVLPQAPSRFLLSGLGRSSSATGNGSNGVGFSESLDLAADLKDRSTAPVLQYTTADNSPPPLRVAIGSAYRPQPGVWLPWGRPWRSSSGKPELSTNPQVPEPTGLSPDVPRSTFSMDVRHNLLQDPYLASPYPLVGADLRGVEWGADHQTQSIRVAQRPDSYTVSYLRLEPTAAMLRSAPPLSDRERFLFDLDLRLEKPYVETVSTLSEQLTAGKTSTYDKAMAIQEYLRADGGFTYSLTLAPPAKNLSGSSAGYDSLTNFLATKRGYCVQFATAMVMMSRAAGIPARMAIGFLPGTKVKGVWTVVAADAHAWPELYLDGIGWTRFEPTPSRGAPPVYATPATSPGTAVDGNPLSKATAPVPGTTARKDLGATSTDSGARTAVGLSPASVLRWLTHGRGAVVLGFLIGLFGCLVLPIAALWRRRRSLSTAPTAARRVEVEWELLTSSLSDLGIAPAPSRTPRQLRAYYDREALLDGGASQALGRVVQTLERSRYAVSPPPAHDLSTDTQLVFRAAAKTRNGRKRLRAALWPSSGIIQLRSAGAHFAGRIRTPLRQVSDVMHRRSIRRTAESGDPAAPR
jgi:transglutaminase-like putative cysteine protease